PAGREPLVLRLRLALAGLHAGLGGGAAAARLALIECLLAERLALGGVGAGIQAALRGVLRLRLAVGRARVGWRRRAPVRVAGALDGRRQVRAAVVATAFPVAAGLQRAPLLGAVVGTARRRIAVEAHAGVELVCRSALARRLVRPARDAAPGILLGVLLAEPRARGRRRLGALAVLVDAVPDRLGRASRAEIGVAAGRRAGGLQLIPHAGAAGGTVGIGRRAVACDALREGGLRLGLARRLVARVR